MGAGGAFRLTPLYDILGPQRQQASRSKAFPSVIAAVDRPPSTTQGDWVESVDACGLLVRCGVALALQAPQTPFQGQDHGGGFGFAREGGHLSGATVGLGVADVEGHGWKRVDSAPSV